MQGFYFKRNFFLVKDFWKENQGMSEKDDDKKVGYKRPPRKTQFAPGQSGNPSGKSKGTRNIATELQDILNETITIASSGALKTMTKQRALASSLVSAAIEGDLKATAIVMSHLAKDFRKGADEDDADDFEAVRSHQKRKMRNTKTT